MTIKERIVRIDAYDGLLDTKDVNDSVALDAYFSELVSHERSINNEHVATILDTYQDMDCEDIGAILLSHVDSGDFKNGRFGDNEGSPNAEECAVVSAYIISRILQDESYNILINPIDIVTYSDTSGTLDDRSRKAYTEDCIDRCNGIRDMATLMLSESMKDDDLIMSFRDSLDGSDESVDDGTSEVDPSNMNTNELLIEILNTLRTIKNIDYEIMKSLAERHVL